MRIRLVVHLLVALCDALAHSKHPSVKRENLSGRDAPQSDNHLGPYGSRDKASNTAVDQMILEIVGAINDGLKK